jgi:putative radical SAM enzyme (TIGR03279 family)
MTLFQELEIIGQHKGGLVTAVQPRSAAAKAGVQVGDELVAVNGNPVEDVIDVQFYAAEPELQLTVRRQGEELLLGGKRAYNRPLGLEFDHPTFDTDIRRCNNLCEFCFVLQMAPRFRRTLYIKDDDYRYSFLFGHFVTLTNLSDHDWHRIETMGLSPLYVSVHVTDWELRRKFLRNPTAPDIMEQLRWLAARGVKCHTQLVVVPEFNDGPWLERSIRELAELWPSVLSISVVPVGLTKQHKYSMRTHTPEEAAAVLDYVERLQPDFQAQMGIRFAYPTDEWYIVSGRPIPPLEVYDGQQLQENGLGMARRFLDDWTAIQQEIQEWQGKMGALRPSHAPTHLTLATGQLFSGILREAAALFDQLAGTETEVMTAVNERLGGTITAAGLLMAEDVIRQLQQLPRLGEIVVLPRIMFDHPDVISLDDMTPQAVANQLQRPVALADLMGDVWDAVTGESSVLFKPE